MTLHTHLLPAHIDAAALRGVVIVIDQLRASSTMVAALTSGARAVIPCLAPDEARAAKQCASSAGLVAAPLLGGERHGALIPGFDLANSPRDYTPQRVAARTIIFTTTNGTRALLHASAADHVLIGCLNNRAAVARRAIQLARDGTIHLLCAGTGGMVCMDDALAAGAIADAILNSAAGGDQPLNHDDTTRIVCAAFINACRQGLLAALRDSLGGRNLIELGLDADIVDCAALDTRDAVPAFNNAVGEVRLDP